MAIYELPTETAINFTKGPDRLFVYLAGQIPLLVPMILFSFFLIISLSGYFLQDRRSGKGDFPMWFAIAGFLTTGLVLILSVIEGLVIIEHITITLSITILGFLWLVLTRN